MYHSEGKTQTSTDAVDPGHYAEWFSAGLATRLQTVHVVDRNDTDGVRASEQILSKASAHY